MANPFIGEIFAFAGNFAPRGYVFCQGQLLQISEYDTLYSLLGTTFGGDGQTTFGIPDLRGRLIIGAGQGPNLSAVTPGQQGGVEQVTLSTQTMAAHSHPANSQPAKATSSSPVGNLPSLMNTQPAGEVLSFYAPAANTIKMDPSMVGATGGTSPVATLAPYQSINYIMAVEGVYPPQS